jgi:hypothetical protein
MHICSIDPRNQRIKNFAICIENIDTNKLKEITMS